MAIFAVDMTIFAVDAMIFAFDDMVIISVEIRFFRSFSIGIVKFGNSARFGLKSKLLRFVANFFLSQTHCRCN